MIRHIVEKKRESSSEFTLPVELRYGAIWLFDREPALGSAGG
jgi:hypothetical protein